jgi:tRNA1(Val) A37 N6-methylase TrmN6
MHRDKATENLVASIKKNKPYLTEIKIAKQVFNLYYGGIHIFRPLNAYRFYRAFPQCKKILDPTMGWGGRLLAACLSVPHIEKYVGIDCNQALCEPYQNMTHFLKKRFPSFEMDIRFQDALSVDYSAIDYDMVFTSPPFYNKEVYSHNTIYSKKEDWDTLFYEPLFKKTWEYLQVGGIYALTIPEILYERVCFRILGEAKEVIELKKYARILPKEKKKQTNVGQKYKEFIYVWKKEG